MGIIADIVAGIKAKNEAGKSVDNKNAFLSKAVLEPDHPDYMGDVIVPLESELKSRGFNLKEYLNAGSTGMIFRDELGDIVRLSPVAVFDIYKKLNSDVTLRGVTKETIIINRDNGKAAIKFTVERKPLGVVKWQDKAVDKNDVLTVAAILHHRGQLTHWMDLIFDRFVNGKAACSFEEAVTIAAQDKIRYIYNPETKDVLRFSNDQPIPFIADTNSLYEDEKVAHILSGGTGKNSSAARTYLKKAFHRSTNAALDKLLAERFEELPPHWQESLQQQEELLKDIAQRHGVHGEHGGHGEEKGKGGKWRDLRPPSGRPAPAKERHRKAGDRSKD